VRTGADVGPIRLAPTNVFDYVFSRSSKRLMYALGTEDRVRPGDSRTYSSRPSGRFRAGDLFGTVENVG